MLVVLLFSFVAVDAAGAQAGSAALFSTATIRFEQNATDGDMEVVFEVKAHEDGLTMLKVVSPDGRTVIDFAAPDSTTMGMRQFTIESPEPTNVTALQAAYPEGDYQFTGKTFAGDAFAGTATLSHRLPATAEIKSPNPEADDVAIKDVVIAWSAVAGAASYILELELDEPKMKIKAVLPSTLTSFALPNGLLLPGMEYTLGLGTVAEDGNISFVEASFTTKN
jgi:hypothetical protein